MTSHIQVYSVPTESKAPTAFECTGCTDCTECVPTVLRVQAATRLFDFGEMFRIMSRKKRFLL